MINFKNKNIILTMVAIALFATGFYVNDPFGLFQYNLKSAAPLLGKLDENKVKKIVVKENGEVLRTFTNDNGTSKVEEGKTYLANNKKLSTGIENLQKIKRYRVITSNKDKQAQYQVTENDFVLEITLEGEKKPVKLFLGKPGASFNTTVVRLEEESEIYSAPGALRNDWNQPLDTYRNKRLFNFAKANISAIEVSGPHSYKLSKNTLGKFTILLRGEEKPALKSRADNIFSQLAKLEGTNFVTGRAPTKNFGQVKVYLQNNLTAELDVRGPDKSSQFVITSNQTQTPMFVPKYKIDSIMVDPAQLEDKTSPGTNSGVPPLKGN